MKRIQFKSNSPYLMPLPPFFIDDLRFFKWRCDLKWFWCKFDVELIRIETVASWPHIHNTATLSTHVCNWLVPLDRATGIQRQPGMKKLAHNQEYETWRQDSCGAGGCQSPFVMYHGDTYHLVEDMATVRVASHFSVMQNMTQNQLGVVYHAIQISHRFGVITDSDIRSSKTATGLTTSQPCPIWRPASFSCVWQTKNAPCANSSLQRAMAWYENHNGDGQNHQIKCVAWINQSIMTQSSLNLAHIDTKLSIMRAATSFMHRLLLNAQSRVPYENQNGAAFRTTEIWCATSATRSWGWSWRAANFFDDGDKEQWNSNGTVKGIMLYREDPPVHARWTTVNPKMTPILNAGVVLHDGVASPQVMSPRMMRAVRHERTCAAYAASGRGVISPSCGRPPMCLGRVTYFRCCACV